MFHLAESGFGNWLYIVFGIIYFLYQLFSAGKKKDKNPPPQTNNPHEDEDFDYPEDKPSKNPLEELFDKLKDLEKQKSPQGPVQTVQQTEIKPVQSSSPPKRKSRARTAPLEVIEIEEKAEQNTLLPGVTLRDAFIASEILKRPEY